MIISWFIEKFFNSFKKDIFLILEYYYNLTCDNILNTRRFDDKGINNRKEKDFNSFHKNDNQYCFEKISKIGEGYKSHMRLYTKLKNPNFHPNDLIVYSRKHFKRKDIRMFTSLKQIQNKFKNKKQLIKMLKI